MNKFCMKCGSKLENGQKFCASCGNSTNVQPQKNNSTLAIIISIFGVIILIGGISSLSKDLTDYTNKLQTTEEKEEGNTCYVTLELFNEIKNGMTYEDVVKLIGCDGTLSSDVGDEDYNIKMYYWYGEDNISNMVLSFDNGKLSGKSQIGLK